MGARAAMTRTAVRTRRALIQSSYNLGSGYIPGPVAPLSLIMHFAAIMHLKCMIAAKCMISD
jgi:hypothetical protein